MHYLQVKATCFSEAPFNQMLLTVANKLFSVPYHIEH